MPGHGERPAASVAALGGGPHGPAADLPQAGTWAPMRLRVFRMLWIAQLVSNVGTWMQTVGAQWMLVQGPSAATLTALAQAAGLVPVLFVSLPAGVLADVLDRRGYLVAVFTGSAVLAGVLAVLTVAGQATPAVLILLTLALGVTSAAANPAWQAIQPELVPPRLIPQAAALGSMNVNIARALGPALAGVLLTVAGPAWVFAVNALSTVAVVGALLVWRRPALDRTGAEDLVPALRSGARYVVNAPGVRRILLRSALFVVPGSALWALLAVVASGRLGLGSGGYGVLLGALGAGAVLGALVMRRLRERLPSSVLLAVFSLLYAAGLLAAALLDSMALLVLALLVAGVGWLAVLSTFNTTLQLTLPAWVRARGLAAYLVVFMGGQGVGAVVWGFVAQRAGVATALVVAAALMAAGVLTLAWWPLSSRIGTLDRTVDVLWPEPELDEGLVVDPRTGPVVVLSRYVVTADVAGFLAMARRVEVSRRRTGATDWALYRDAGDASVFVEMFTVPTWGEHLRQHHERLTGYDRELEVRLDAFSDLPTQVRHLLPPPE
ncbi:MAG TPA: MFS transporter [Cellulomonas sp.]